MSEPLKPDVIKKAIIGLITAKKVPLTNLELMNSFKRYMKDWPFDGFGPSFYQFMEECNCISDDRGRWIGVGNLNQNTANLQSVLSNQKGRINYDIVENTETYKRGNDNTTNGIDRPECSYGGNRPENGRLNSNGHGHPANGYSTNSNIDGSDSDGDDDFEAPGLTAGSGYRYVPEDRPATAEPAQNQTSISHSRSSTATPGKQVFHFYELSNHPIVKPSGARFSFPPPRNGNVNSSVPNVTSTVPVQDDMSDDIPYDELCSMAIENFVSAWPGFMNAEELMNYLARKTKLPELVGSNLMNYHEKIIAMINKNERNIYTTTIEEENVFSYIPGIPTATHESDLYEQVGKMICLILNTYNDMTIEVAQDYLGFSDNIQYTKLDGCALILDVSNQNKSIIVGRGKDRKLSLRFGTSVEDFRSQIRISPKSTPFTDRKADLSPDKKIKKLLSECENYISDEFPMFNSHPMVEIGPEPGVVWCKGTMIYFSSLDKFTVRLDNDATVYEELQSYLKEDYEGLEWSDVLLNYIKEGAAVAVKMDDGKFARGIVTHYDRNPNESSFVYLVDEGCIEEAPINNIFPLKDETKTLHPLGIRCTINAFRANPDKSEKFFAEHKAIWNTLHRESFVEIYPTIAHACGGKKEVLVELKFELEGESYHYPKDLIDNKIICLI